MKLVFQLAQMIFIKCLISFVFICINVCPSNKGDSLSSTIPNFSEFSQLPTVQISILIRNKAHSLPYFLGNFERLNYPKSRLGLFIRLDHSQDNSSQVIQQWLNNTKSQYHYVNYIEEPFVDVYPDETQISQWTKERFEKIMDLKEEALQFARENWADYLFYADADVMLIDEDILQHLMENNVPIVSPLLKCTDTPTYANFWGAMTERGYYSRSKNYFEIQERKKMNIFEVPMVHSVYLINLNIKNTQNLTFKPTDLIENFPYDDIILFAKSASITKSSMYVDNRYLYGYFSSPMDDGNLDREIEIFDHTRFQIMLDREDTEKMFIVKPSKYLTVTLPEKSKLGLDEVYLVNLKRRPDRYEKMQYLFDQLGIDAKYFEAVDGRKLNETYLNELGVKQMPGYSDPYHKRDLKMGEIGCFLSHYFIWQEMLKMNYERILIFEDDIRFGPGFVRSLKTILSDADNYEPNWELLYIGRKRLSDKETLVKSGVPLAYPDYTYWTLGYLLTKSGAEKLIKQNPLSRLIAVDEYLPIMFDRHPRDDWKNHFSPRNMVALSSEPLLLEPTHYTGEPNYISDTEDSVVVDNTTIISK